MKIRTSGVSIGVLQVMAVLALALAGLLLGLGAGHAQTGAPPSSLAPRLGFVAPNTQLETLAGDRFDLAHWRGKVVVLDFWATWCGPCLGALPALKQLNIDYAGKPFALVSISGDRDGSNLHEFVANHGMSWTQCWDGNGDAQRRFRVRGLPTYFVLDAAGRIVYGATGWSRGAERPLRNAIEKAFAASPPAAAGPAAGTTTLR